MPPQPPPRNCTPPAATNQQHASENLLTLMARVDRKGAPAMSEEDEDLEDLDDDDLDDDWGEEPEGEG